MPFKEKNRKIFRKKLREEVDKGSRQIVLINKRGFPPYTLSYIPYHIKEAFEMERKFQGEDVKWKEEWLDGESDHEEWRDLTGEEREIFILKKFEGIPRKVLARYSHKISRADYDDYLQELRLKLWFLVKKFDGDCLGEDKPRFISYATQGLQWKMIELLRKQSREQKRCICVDWQEDMDSWALENLPWRDPGMSSEERERIEREYLMLASEVLSTSDWEIFQALFQKRALVTELARERGITRQAMYKRVKRIYQSLKEVLKILFED